MPMSKIYIGYDPGGRGAHGVAVINGNRVNCDTVATAFDAIKWLEEQCADEAPSALGVDSLTLWSTGRAGWRPADRALKAEYIQAEKSVKSPNSLRGSMSINGAAVAMRLQQKFADLFITETHPKVLYYALTRVLYNFADRRGQMVKELLGWLGLTSESFDFKDKTDDAWDALISAYAAREWHNKRWTMDLHQLPGEQSEELFSPFNKPAFAWPYKIPSLRTERTLRTVQTVGNTPKRSPRIPDRWRVAVEVLENAGHHDVAQQVADYRNVRNERSGWDSWLKAEFPALWELIPAAE